jgi:hypothetical protein
MSTITWTAEFISYLVAVAYYSFHIILYANVVNKYVYYVRIMNQLINIPYPEPIVFILRFHFFEILINIILLSTQGHAVV